MMKASPAEKISALHEKGWTVTEISQELKMSADDVRAAITGNWDEDKKRQSVAEKVAGRLGKGYFNR